MSDIMTPIPMAQLMEWVLSEKQKSGSIFGIRKMVQALGEGALPIFSRRIETPFGPAAGPHTQLAQNIIASYIAGSRFFELKTVQIIDGEELSRCIPKPCIQSVDECYNCEWSTELSVSQAYEEYVKAWFVCHLLSREFELGRPDGFVFNMSVGYDFAGIKSEKIDSFLEGMKDASSSNIWTVCRNWIFANLDRFVRVDAAFVDAISPNISNSVTESTLHGCPPEEIERIASYLIVEKKLNTYIKCNPTLLGFDFARTRLDGLGYDYISFDDHHFLGDLQWKDALPMFSRLLDLSAEHKVEFGLKLANTFPVDVAHGELPSNEMYMSGRPLFPLTVALAHRIAREFDGTMRVSFSGGITAHNLRDLFNTGIWPITIASDILKPGGYERFSQMVELFEDIDDKVRPVIDAQALTLLEKAIDSDPLYRKPIHFQPHHKVSLELPLMNCFTAPCRFGCAIEQDIPAYLMAVDQKRYNDALSIIIERNPLPFITGTICPHKCGDFCERSYYELEGAEIRASKLIAARKGFELVLNDLRNSMIKNRGDKRVAIIGGGPAGMATAFFLTRAGISVTIFEARDKLGGIVRWVIPSFRILDADIDKDSQLCQIFGAEVQLNTRISSIKELFDKGYSDVVIAVGAWLPGHSNLPKGQEIDVLEFLETIKKNRLSLKLGTDVVVIGAGNTGVDAARAAMQLKGVKKVRIVYRRTRKECPADDEELKFAQTEGVEFCELLSPKERIGSVLICDLMRLGEVGSDGRSLFEATGETVSVPATSVICAVGERIDTSLFESCNMNIDNRGCPVNGFETGIDAVWAIGDCCQGPATIVEAIADAARVAQRIAGVGFDGKTAMNVASGVEESLLKKGIVCLDTSSDIGTRCLGCATVCEICCDVCPNRANVAVCVPGLSQQQIVHMDGMCNECGNCAVFCPYKDGLPYRNKLTLFWTEKAMKDSDNEGFLAVGHEFKIRLKDKVGTYDVDATSCDLPVEVRKTIKSVKNSYSYLLSNIETAQ